MTLINRIPLAEISETVVIQDFDIFRKVNLNSNYVTRGIAVLVKNDLSKCVSLVTNIISNSVLWLKINKNVFGLDFVLGAVYIPHEGSQYHDKDAFENIAEDIVYIKSKYVTRHNERHKWSPGQELRYGQSKSKYHFLGHRKI